MNSPMKPPSLLVHIRHAEQERIPGVLDRDMPLSPRGHEHASNIGVMAYKRFGAFDQVIYSDFFRTKQTAEHIVAPYTPEERRGMLFVQKPFLNERDTGDIFGLSDEEIEKRFPGFSRHRERVGEIYAHYPGGENLASLFLRMEIFLLMSRDEWAGKKICLVGHWGTSFALRRYYEGLSDRELLEAMGLEHPPHGSLLVFKPGPEAINESSGMVLREKNVLLCDPPQATEP